MCEKNATRKRKVFDSLKQRVEGTDLAQFHQKTYLKKPEAPPVAPIIPDIKITRSKWKEKHLELVNAIRAAKGEKKPKLVSSLTPLTVRGVFYQIELLLDILKTSIHFVILNGISYTGWSKS